MAMAALKHHIGDSVVQYKCDWSTSDTYNGATDGYRTLAGVGARTNRCKQTTLLGLTVLPLKATSKKVKPFTTSNILQEQTFTIEPGDLLRIDFPPTAAAQIVDKLAEELYRVNAVYGNDVIVTPKPLGSSVNTDAHVVNRHRGGTSVDLLKNLDITLTTETAIPANAAAHDIVMDKVHTYAQGHDYCLIDGEFFYIKSLTEATRTYELGDAATTAGAADPATADVAEELASNRGRNAFATKKHGAAIPVGKTCAVYRYVDTATPASTAAAQIQAQVAVEHDRDGDGAYAAADAAKDLGRSGFTYIHDPRVTIRPLQNGIAPDRKSVV